MNLANHFFVAVAITSCTGALALGIWLVIERLFGHDKPELVYLVLRVVCILYILPVGYSLLQMTIRSGYIRSSEVWQAHFATTSSMNRILIPLEALGIFVLVRNIVMYIKDLIALRDIIFGTIPEEDGMAIAVFQIVKAKLGIRKEIQLCRNDMIFSPMITGIFHPVIILPYRDYTREQLEVIYYHELLHYKTHDVFYNICAKYVSMLPFIGAKWNVPAMVKEWSEKYCDYRAIRAMGAKDKGRHYFETIVDAMKGTPLHETGVDSIYPMLCEDCVGLERRLDIMKNFDKIKALARGTSAACALIFVAANVTTVYGAGSLVVGMNDRIFEATVEGSEIDVMDGTHLVVSAPEDEQSYSQLVFADPEAEDIMPALDADTPVTFNWTVVPHVRMVSSAYWLKSGRKVVISAVATPSTSTFDIGIMNVDNGYSLYSEGEGGLTQTFTVPSTGSWRVYVENKSDVTITAAGSYYYY